MAEGRRGLGRGLSALLGEGENQVAEAEIAALGASELPIELLRRNPEQPRQSFDEAELDELAASIRKNGIIQPLLVRPAPGAPGEYQIVAGERRWRAAQRAGLRAVPVVVRELDDGEVLELAIIENIQRADLNPIEEAMGYKVLLDRFEKTQEAVAEVVGKSRSHVANALRLLQLPDEVREHLIAGRLSAGHARAIGGADDPAALARQVVQQGLTVRDAEALARKGAAPRVKAPRATDRPQPHKDADTAALEDDLEEILGLKVEVIDRNGAGEVRIRYATLEQLDDLCRRLTG